MELTTIHRRVIGLDMHQAQITACAIVEESNGTTRIEQRKVPLPPSYHSSLSPLSCEF